VNKLGSKFASPSGLAFFAFSNVAGKLGSKFRWRSAATPTSELRQSNLLANLLSGWVCDLLADLLIIPPSPASNLPESLLRNICLRIRHSTTARVYSVDIRESEKHSQRKEIMVAVKGSTKGSEERDLVALRRNRLHAISEMFDMGWSIEVIAALNLTIALEEDSSIIDRRIAYILGGTIAVPGEGVIGDPELEEQIA